MSRCRWFYARHSVEVVEPLNRRFLVVGSGRAGSARAKALENMVGFEAVVLPSRSPQFFQDFERFLGDSTIEGVLICTANREHYGLAYRALNAGKHTLVEFPLARTEREGVRLFRAADENDVVLHVEFIGLMTGEHLWLSRFEKSIVHSVDVDMRGGFYRWVADDAEEGFIGTLAIGRLQALHHIWGPLTLLKQRFETLEQGYRLTCEFISTNQVRIQLTDHRQPGLGRRRDITLRDANGDEVSVGRIQIEGQLFARDFSHFLGKIAKKDYRDETLPSRDDILSVMALADQISRRASVKSEIDD